MLLPDVVIRSLKPLEKPYAHFDGGGLHGHVAPNGVGSGVCPPALTARAGVSQDFVTL